jgi:sugar O-acyltransferase (sialic acid O-acetyltransferase NeuD family)
MTWAILGAGAQGRITLDILRDQPLEEEVVFVDDDERLRGRELHGVIVADRSWLLRNRDRAGFKAIVAIGNNLARLRVAEEMGGSGVPFGNVIHRSAVVLSSAVLGAGVVVCPAAVVGSGARIGNHALINTGAVVEHDCVLGEGVSISPGVRMGGRVEIGRAAFIGVGTTLVPRVRIGAGSIVGAGSVVTRDVSPGTLVYGVPARTVRAVDPERDWPRLL